MAGDVGLYYLENSSFDSTTSLQLLCEEIQNNNVPFGTTFDPLCITTQTPSERSTYYGLVATVFLAITFGVVGCATLVGNVLVILSIALEKRLQSPPNILIANLAVADLAVGVLVIPLAIAQELTSSWRWSYFLCGVWTTADVMSCTASIVTLCMISVDRYYAITRPFQYAPKRTPRLMSIMIAVVWIISAFISLSALIFWGGNEIDNGNACIINQDKIFTIYSTFGAFYVPLAVMVIVYYKIYRAAKLSQRTELHRRPSAFSNISNSRRGSSLSKGSSGDSEEENGDRKKSLIKFTGYLINKARPSVVSIRTSAGKHKISLRGERKAAKTLGVIMGAFIVCWLPFFIVALIRPFCQNEIPRWLDVTFLWLGYINSVINPIIYPFFNKDFRPVYKRMLSCKCIRECSRLKRHDHRYSRRSGSATMCDASDGAQHKHNRDQNQNGDFHTAGKVAFESKDDTHNTHMSTVYFKSILPYDLDKIIEASEESGCEVV